MKKDIYEREVFGDVCGEDICGEDVGERDICERDNHEEEVYRREICKKDSSTRRQLLYKRDSWPSLKGIKAILRKRKLGPSKIEKKDWIDTGVE